MNHDTPTIGVVIVSYNTSQLLANCLASLQQSTLPLRIIVVDNASADDSVATVRTRVPSIQLCALERNMGFAAANNIGLCWLTDIKEGVSSPNTSSPDFLLLLNPDTIVHAGALEALVAFLQAHPRVGIVAPRLLNPDGTIQTAAFRFPTLSMSLLDVFPPGEATPGRLYGSWWHGRYHQERNGDAPFPIDHPLGACMLVRQRVIEEVGLLDESYFMYSEEIEWCWRIRRAGWAIWQEPQAHVTHIGGAATSQVRATMLIELHRSRVCFFRRHYSAGFLAAHRAITRAGMLRSLLLAWYDYLRHRLPRSELRARLWAYGHIARL